MKLINAEALYNEVREKRDVYAKRLDTNPESDSDLFYYSAFQIVLSIIRDQKIIDDERIRHGEWIEDDYGFFRCSECGFEFDDPEVKTPCCQSCGAIMTNYVNDEIRGTEYE